MHIANTLHPDVFQFDLMSEADRFYRTFYDMPFNPGEINRSFQQAYQHVPNGRHLKRFDQSDRLSVCLGRHHDQIKIPIDFGLKLGYIAK